MSTKRGKSLISAGFLAELLRVKRATLYNWISTFTDPIRFNKKGRAKCMVALTLVDATLLIMVQQILEHMSTFKARSLFADTLIKISQDDEEKSLEYLKKAQVILGKRFNAVSDGPITFLGEGPVDCTVLSFASAMKKATPALFEYSPQELEALGIQSHP